ncbi:unnamed protein product [Parnassius apollo]|uniref:Snurportin-1 n=1 Tax=Parnassius apollo TaxID=110799 RepID=A0A8S3WSL9_PARAO|nr:unnamed protein product [Parnassius apollo]
MDEVLNKFDNVLNCKELRDDQKQNTYENLYKNWGKLGNQEIRRKEILAIQKGNRNNELDSVRGLLELVGGVKEDHIFKSQRVAYRPNIYVAGFHKTSPVYNNVLMLSEWLIEKPEDFNENWYVVPCPTGVRVLVVADNGITKFFTKNGRFLMECRTALPGGNPTNINQRRGSFCVLDGFYVEKNNTMYVLDLLAWNSQPMTDGETEFRQYWLKTQLQELGDLYKVSKKNKVIFQLLPMVSCSTESFNNFMMKYPQFESNFPPLDGLLFYHKMAHYVAGETPLVGWLFPYMVKEVLGSNVTVNSIYELQTPSDYVTQAEFIQKFTAKNAKRQNRSRRSSSNIMETETIGCKEKDQASDSAQQQEKITS